jgi:tRNA threonylcarbamoyladenosine biosynthesis protein TsaE
MKITTNSPKETLAFAKNFVKTLKGGEVIGLIGDLGAGKTAFTQGLAKGLGIKNKVNSPTFVIMKLYPIKNLKLKIKNLLHIDAYRLKSASDLETIGALEYFGKPDTIVVIEWADRVKKILPPKTVIIKIKIKGETRSLLFNQKYAR